MSIRHSNRLLLERLLAGDVQKLFGRRQTRVSQVYAEDTLRLVAEAEYAFGRGDDTDAIKIAYEALWLWSAALERKSDPNNATKFGQHVGRPADNMDARLYLEAAKIRDEQGVTWGEAQRLALSKDPDLGHHFTNRSDGALTSARKRGKKGDGSLNIWAFSDP